MQKQAADCFSKCQSAGYSSHKVPEKRQFWFCTLAHLWRPNAIEERETYCTESEADIPGAMERFFTRKTFLSRASCYSIYTYKNSLSVGIQANTTQRGPSRSADGFAGLPPPKPARCPGTYPAVAGCAAGRRGGTRGAAWAPSQSPPERVFEFFSWK